uniref:Myosin_tail_1 domain-containing protein n=1 Tax=Globodera pallida TaxID=36090 RepID=A0A183CKX9_GLOPA
MTKTVAVVAHHQHLPHVHHHVMATLGQHRGGKICKQHNGTTFDGRSPSPNAHDRHANVELAAAKAELRKLRNENDEKEEMLLELQDELERQRAEIGRLQAERLELVKDARAAKDLRDEMDCMQHKLSRLERLETDAEKMRTKLGELDFYRSRVNNLKEDNRLMQETCRVMEEQLEQCQRKLSAHLEVETKLIESQANNKSLQLDLTKTRAHVEDLLIENGRLERELKANVQRHAELERAMQHCNVADEAHAASSPRGDTLHDASLLAQLDAYNHKLKARLSSGESVPNPAEMFELKAELNAHEKLAEEKITECQHLRANLELGRKEVREAEEREHELRAEIDKMERQLADQRRTTVSIQTHQLVVERLESTERKSQELEQRMTIEQILRAEFTRERNQLEQALEEERVERQREMRRVAELEAEMASLDKELVELKRERSSTMFRNAADSADELRRLRMSECAQKSSINSLNVIIQQLNNALTEKDLELGNLRRQVEMLRQYNGEENRTLIKQIELLLIQNQQLHNRSDAFYAEQKELQEKLMTLRRHKEKLEEKIMEQYKQMDSRKSTERPTFMKRAAKLISKSPSRKPKELSVTTANSASDRSEDSSIYSTDELTTTTTPTSRNTTALANSP